MRSCWAWDYAGDNSTEVGALTRTHHHTPHTPCASSSCLRLSACSTRGRAGPWGWPGLTGVGVRLPHVALVGAKAIRTPTADRWRCRSWSSPLSGCRRRQLPSRSSPRWGAPAGNCGAGSGELGTGGIAVLPWQYMGLARSVACTLHWTPLLHTSIRGACAPRHLLVTPALCALGLAPDRGHHRGAGVAEAQAGAPLCRLREPAPAQLQAGQRPGFSRKRDRSCPFGSSAGLGTEEEAGAGLGVRAGVLPGACLRAESGIHGTWHCEGDTHLTGWRVVTQSENARVLREFCL